MWQSFTCLQKPWRTRRPPGGKKPFSVLQPYCLYKWNPLLPVYNRLTPNTTKIFFKKKFILQYNLLVLCNNIKCQGTPSFDDTEEKRVILGAVALRNSIQDTGYPVARYNLYLVCMTFHAAASILPLIRSRASRQCRPGIFMDCYPPLRAGYPQNHFGPPPFSLYTCTVIPSFP